MRFVFLAGEDNRCFAPESQQRSFEFFARHPWAGANFVRYARSVHRALKRKSVRGLSIGYETKHSTAPTPEDKANGVRRYLDEVKLVEVSAVIWGMNADALVDTETAKALLAKKDLSDDERAQLEEVRARIDALLDSEEPAPDDGVVETASAEKGLAPDRLASIQQRLLAIKLRRLATRASGPARVGT